MGKDAGCLEKEPYNKTPKKHASLKEASLPDPSHTPTKHIRISKSKKRMLSLQHPILKRPKGCHIPKQRAITPLHKIP